MSHRIAMQYKFMKRKTQSLHNFNLTYLNPLLKLFISFCTSVSLSLSLYGSSFGLN